MIYYCLNQYSIYSFCFSQTQLLRSMDSNSNNLIDFHLPLLLRQTEGKAQSYKGQPMSFAKAYFFTFGNFSSLLSSHGVPTFSPLLGFAGKGAVPVLQKIKHTAIVYSFPQIISPVRSLISSIIKLSSCLRVSF